MISPQSITSINLEEKFQCLLSILSLLPPYTRFDIEWERDDIEYVFGKKIGKHHDTVEIRTRFWVAGFHTTYGKALKSFSVPFSERLMQIFYHSILRYVMKDKS